MTTNQLWTDLVNRGDVHALKKIQADEVRAAERILDEARAGSGSLDPKQEIKFEEHTCRARELRDVIEHAQERRSRIERDTARYYRSENYSHEWRSLLAGRGGEVELDFGSTMRDYLKSGKKFESRDLTTANVGSVPTSVLQEVVMRMVEESAVLNASPRIINTSTGESLKVPTFTSYSTAAIVAEGSAIPESDPDTETVTLGAYHFAVLRDVSNQLLTDTDFDLGLYLGEEMGRAIGQAIGSYIDSANAGTSAPQGVFGTATTTGVTGTAANYVPTTNELVGLYYSVGERYRTNGSWVMSSNTAKTLANLVDTTGRSLLLPNLSGDAVGTIMGRPVYTSPNVPAAGSAVASIAFGDFSRFIAVRYAGGMRIDLSRDFRFSQDLTSYRASMRFDSKILDASAVKKFVGKDG